MPVPINNPYYTPAALVAPTPATVTYSSVGGGGGGGANESTPVSAGRGLAAQFPLHPALYEPPHPSRGINLRDRLSTHVAPHSIVQTTTFEGLPPPAPGYPLQHQFGTEDSGLPLSSDLRAGDLAAGGPAIGSHEWQMEVETFVDDLVNLELARRTAGTAGGDITSSGPAGRATEASFERGRTHPQSPPSYVMAPPPGESSERVSFAPVHHTNGVHGGGNQYRMPGEHFPAEYRAMGPGPWEAPVNSGLALTNTPVVHHVRNLTNQFNQFARQPGVATPTTQGIIRTASMSSPFHHLGSTVGGKPLEFSKASKAYIEKLSRAGLTISISQGVPELFQAFSLIMPVIQADAGCHATTREQCEWIYRAVGEIVPFTMWSTFELRAKAELQAVTSMDELVAVMGKYLFKVDSSPAAAKSAFENFKLSPHHATQLAHGAAQQLNRCRQGFLGATAFVDGCVSMLSGFPEVITTTVNSYWKVGQGASLLAHHGIQAHIFNEDVLTDIGIHMLEFLEKVQLLVPRGLLPSKPPSPARPPVPPIAVGAMGAFRGSCLNCREQGHAWRSCTLARREDFPICTHTVCVTKDRHIGHSLSRCFVEHPELAWNRRPPPSTVESPTKKKKVAFVNETDTAPPSNPPNDTMVRESQLPPGEQ